MVAAVAVKSPKSPESVSTTKVEAVQSWRQVGVYDTTEAAAKIAEALRLAGAEASVCLIDGLSVVVRADDSSAQD